MNAKLPLGLIDLDTDHEIGRALQHNGYAAVAVEGQTVLHLTTRYRDSYLERWMDCTYERATHLFISFGPTRQGFQNRVGTYYPQSGYLIVGGRATKTHVEAAVSVLQLLDRNTSTELDISLMSTDRDAVVQLRPSSPARRPKHSTLSMGAREDLRKLLSDAS